MRKPRRGDIALVEWVDSASMAHSWPTVEEARAATPARCVSVGFVAHITKRRVNLVQSTTDGHADNLITIPMFAVRKIRRIKP